MTATPVTAPKVNSVTFSPSSSYAPGATVTATVNYSPGSSSSPGTASTFTVNSTATDAVTSQTGTLSGTFTVTGAAVTSNDLTTPSVSDGVRTWVKVSDTGTAGGAGPFTAVFTTTA